MQFRAAWCGGGVPAAAKLVDPLSRGADPDTFVTDDGATACFVAADGGSSTSSSCLDHFADPNRPAADGRTHSSPPPRRPAYAVYVLLAAGAEPRLAGCDGVTPLHIAAGGHVDVVALLTSSPKRSSTA